MPVGLLDQNLQFGPLGIIFRGQNIRIVGTGGSDDGEDSVSVFDLEERKAELSQEFNRTDLKPEEIESLSREFNSINEEIEEKELAKNQPTGAQLFSPMGIPAPLMRKPSMI